jgi:hypothetical protein
MIADGAFRQTGIDDEFQKAFKELALKYSLWRLHTNNQWNRQTNLYNVPSTPSS